MTQQSEDRRAVLLAMDAVPRQFCRFVIVPVSHVRSIQARDQVDDATGPR